MHQFCPLARDFLTKVFHVKHFGKVAAIFPYIPIAHSYSELCRAFVWSARSRPRKPRLACRRRSQWHFAAGLHNSRWSVAAPRHRKRCRSPLHRDADCLRGSPFLRTSGRRCLKSQPRRAAMGKPRPYHFGRFDCDDASGAAARAAHGKVAVRQAWSNRPGDRNRTAIQTRQASLIFICRWRLMAAISKGSGPRAFRILAANRSGCRSARRRCLWLCRNRRKRGGRTAFPMRRGRRAIPSLTAFSRAV